MKKPALRRCTHLVTIASLSVGILGEYVSVQDPSQEFLREYDINASPPMSAIFGIYHLDGKPVAQDNVERMSEVLAHRGPDGSKIWLYENLGLGHRMLWTTPESLREILPLATADGNLVITADARIDNRDELIRLLGLQNHQADTISDSELILTSYQKWGEQCPEKLLGDFAFAIWDARRQSFFCARDRFGVKPFYY
jgi:asparagine synthase (glutamine-hydrolysing)